MEPVTNIATEVRDPSQNVTPPESTTTNDVMTRQKKKKAKGDDPAVVDTVDYNVNMTFPEWTSWSKQTFPNNAENAALTEKQWLEARREVPVVFEQVEKVSSG